MLNIEKETIIICEDIYKKNILKEMNTFKTLFPVHFMTMEQFIKKYTFDYSYKTILYLMKKYNYKCEIAIKYIKNLYYVENKKYNSLKLNQLVDLKNELDKEKLLKYNPLFKEYIKDKDVIIYKYDLNKYESNIINKIDNVKIINKKYASYNHEVFRFANTNEEVEFVAGRIANLISDGIDINSIKIANIEGYENVIEKIFKMYSIPCNIDFKYPIYGTFVVKEFLNNLDGSFKNAFESIKKYKHTDVYNQIIDICNKYTYDDMIRDILIYDFKHTYIKKPQYKNAVEVIDYKNNEIKDEYVFLVGFNFGSIPRTFKDEDFITDKIKDELYLDLTIEKNAYERNVTINSINNIKNLIITYREMDDYMKINPSDLITLYNIKEIDKSLDISYSVLNDKLKLANYLDKYFKYGEIDKYLYLYNNTHDIPYRTYNNKYNKIDGKLFEEYLSKGLTLSYSSMDKYSRCAFRYYLSNILKLDLYKETFYTLIGNLFHYILQKGLKSDINIDEEIADFIGNIELTNKEKFYLNKLCSELPFILQTIKEKMKLSKLNKSLEETQVVINKEGNINITFKGYIDKIIYNDSTDKTILALIDYKTGYADTNLNYLSYGLNMQLPIYLYLASRLDLKNICFAGLYLQKVLLPEVKKNKEKSSLEQKKDNLKLEGYSTSDEKILSILDATYKDSSMIKGLKLTNNGSFYAYSKVLSNDQLFQLIDFTKNKIDEIEDNILMCNFNINPKKDDTKNIGCENCTFKNICYKTTHDEVYINPIKINNLLGGEDNE